jgi:predicted AAA+ superfamily ATPase
MWGVYLKEEIQQEALVRKVESYFRFLDVAAQMNGEPINFASVARDVGVETKTAQEFVSILVDTLVAFRVEPWTWSVRKQLRHSPKIYFFDCGVLNAVRGDLHAGDSSFFLRVWKIV